jgi:hypothetical protein
MEELCVRVVADDDRVRDVSELVSHGAHEPDDAPRPVLVLPECVQALMDVEDRPEASDRNEPDHEEDDAKAQGQPPGDALAIEARRGPPWAPPGGSRLAATLGRWWHRAII